MNWIWQYVSLLPFPKEIFKKKKQIHQQEKIDEIRIFVRWIAK